MGGHLSAIGPPSYFPGPGSFLRLLLRPEYLSPGDKSPKMGRPPPPSKSPSCSPECMLQAICRDGCCTTCVQDRHRALPRLAWRFDIYSEWTVKLNEISLSFSCSCSLIHISSHITGASIPSSRDTLSNLGNGTTREKRDESHVVQYRNTPVVAVVDVAVANHNSPPLPPKKTKDKRDTVCVYNPCWL